MIQKNTLYLVGLSCLVLGFIGGVVFSAVKNTPSHTAVAPQTASPSNPAVSADQSETAKILAALQKHAEENPQNYEAWVRLGNACYDSGQAHQAITAYEKALAIQDDSANVWTDLGVMYRRHGEPNKAIHCFDEAIKRQSDHLSAHYNKGLVLLADLHDKSGAIAAWQQVVAINPQATAPGGRKVADLLAEIEKHDSP